MSAEPALPDMSLEVKTAFCIAVGLLVIIAVIVAGLLKEAGLGAWPNNPDDTDGLDALRRVLKRWEAKARQREAHRKFRAKPEVKRKRAEVSRRWREQNHAKHLAQPWLQRRAEARNAHYHRPFVTIDSEGMNYPGNDVVYNGVVYPDHRTFLWGAAGVIRMTEPSAQNPHGEFWDLPLHWLGHDDKRALTLVEILNWLTALPEKFGVATFISYGFNYDVTMILQAVADYMPSLAYRKVYEICKKERLGSDGAIKVKGHVFVGDYAIDWIKGKRLVVKKFRDPDDPKAGFIRRITVYDLFGFYQSSFVKVMKSLAKLGLATGEEVATIERDKARRQNFDQVPLGEIKAYTELELRKLSLAAIKLRDGFDYMGIRLGSWSGAGAAAAALIHARGVSEHYAGWVNKRDPSPEQLIAHAAYYGGHIELLKQGYSEAGVFVYDIKSAYPAEMQDLPSMIGGRVRHWNIKDNPTGLDWREVEASSKISAFFIRWRLPTFYVDKTTGEVRGVPFFSLPYRLKGGGILFSSEGSGWFMRDEAIAALRWLEKFVELGLPGVAADGLPCDIAPDVAKKIAPCLGFKRLPRRAKDHGLNLLITEAAFFEADEAQPRPYAFIPELYEERARLRREEPGNVAELPAGSFMMGSSESEVYRFPDEGPPHSVTIAHAFAVSKFELTFDEWDNCVAYGDCAQTSGASWGRGTRPIINVSWEDAQTYVRWLSSVTGKKYRLLTEAEYEYATRAGTQTAYPWGNDIRLNGKVVANCNGCGSRWDGHQTAPVGSFEANQFGLYDMLGNVWEWTDDCYHDSYEGAPSDGSPWTAGDCSTRVVRGGSWNNAPRYLRSANRGQYVVGTRYYTLGFRVARTLINEAGATTVRPDAR